MCKSTVATELGLSLHVTPRFPAREFPRCFGDSGPKWEGILDVRLRENVALLNTACL